MRACHARVPSSRQSPVQRGKERRETECTRRQERRKQLGRGRDETRTGGDRGNEERRAQSHANQTRRGGSAECSAQGDKRDDCEMSTAAVDGRVATVEVAVDVDVDVGPAGVDDSDDFASC